jgi:hypothetical protein
VRFFPSSFLVLIALGSACSSSETGGAGSEVSGDAEPHADAANDATSNDATSNDATTADATTADATAADATSTDATSTDATPADAPVDAPPGDAMSDGDAPSDGGASCSYFPSVQMLAHCGMQWTSVSEWIITGGSTPACPAYYTAGSQTASTIDGLLTQLGCAGACTFTANTAVSFLHCGFRDEYVLFKSSESECGYARQFSDGQVYDSIAAYNAAHPCPPPDAGATDGGMDAASDAGPADAADDGG